MCRKKGPGLHGRRVGLNQTHRLSPPLLSHSPCCQLHTYPAPGLRLNSLLPNQGFAPPASSPRIHLPLPRTSVQRVSYGGWGGQRCPNPGAPFQARRLENSQVSRKYSWELQAPQELMLPLSSLRMKSSQGWGQRPGLGWVLNKSSVTERSAEAAGAVEASWGLKEKNPGQESQDSSGLVALHADDLGPILGPPGGTPRHGQE